MTYSDVQLGLIVVDNIKELSYKQKKLFLASVNKNNPDRQKYADALIKIIGESVYKEVADKFFDQAYRKKITDGLEKRGVTCITIKCGDYPVLLRETPAPPLVLYFRGRAELLKSDMFAVVGSRKTLPQTIERCKSVSADLSKHFTIVTGVAGGADEAAAKGALPSGNIICVLPCGHDSTCAANRALLKEVEKTGLSVSEYPPKTPAQRHTFLLRNRIMAGLSKGVLVVSAAERSGAISTANYAADYSRDVFAFPYNIGVASGAGCNALIKKGAYLCESAEDIYAVTGIEVAPVQKPKLEGDEQKIYDILKENGEMHAEKLAEAIGKKPYEISALCSLMEIKGLIVRLGGNKYALV